MSANTTNFPFDTRFNQETRTYQKVRRVKCSRCGANGAWADNRLSGAPEEGVVQGFRKLGWSLTNHRNAVCPKCLASAPTKSKPAKEPVNAIIVTAIEPETQPKEEALQAEPPRQPTRENRRAIMEALETIYDQDKGRYRGDWTDKHLAEKLNMPRAWIAEERDRYFGPDKSEEDDKRAARISELEIQVSKAMNDALTVAERLETLLKEVQAIKERK